MADDGTFTLRITISGLCMFVPEPNRDIVHVLMPKPCSQYTSALHLGHNGGHASEPHAVFDASHDEEHLVWLAYDPKHAADGAAGSTDLIGMRLHGCVLAVGAKGAERPAAPDANRVVRLDKSVNFAGVDRACLGWNGGGKVTSRLELHSGGAREYYGLGIDNNETYCVDRPDRNCDPAKGGRPFQLMAEHVRWVVGEYRRDEFPNGVSLKDLVRVSPLGDLPADTLGDRMLRPVGPVIDLYLFHATRAALPTRSIGVIATPGTFKHFTMYNCLATPYPNPSVPEPWPEHSKMQLLVPSAVCASSQGTFAT